jgi:type VI secretion system protein VasJ
MQEPYPASLELLLGELAMSLFLEDILNPISDTMPCGEDIMKLAPSPENEEWIRKYSELRGMTNRIATNSEAIVELCQDILVNKSRDLRIAGYLCQALLHGKGFAGLAEGLRSYHILLEEFWDKGLYPERETGRTKGVVLLDKNLSRDIQAQDREDKNFYIPVKPTDADALEEVKQTAEAIKAILSERFPDQPISMDSLVMAVNGRIRAAGTLLKKPEQPAAAQPTPAKEAAEGEQAEGEPAVSEIKTDLDAAKAVAQAANFLLQKDCKNVVPYRLLRSTLWYMLPLFNPEPNASGKRVTQYLPPSGKVKLEKLLEDEDWESLVTECEAVFVERFEAGSGGCFCLDIQRFLCIALKELMSKSEEGGDTGVKEAYEAVHKVILQETAMFVERSPWVTELFYSDETPFVDAQTKNWIEKSVKSVFGTSSNADKMSALPGGEPPEDSRISEDFNKATDLLSRQKWGDALDLMQNGIDAEPTCKGRFQRRLNLASLCLDAGQPSMARPLLEQLDEEIERFSLDQWEPSLCLQVWNNLKRCYQELLSQQASNGFYQEKVDVLFEKICRLDIRAAMPSSAG